MSNTRHYERLKIEQGKHLTVAKHVVPSDHPVHWHRYFEIEIVLSGAGKHVINDVDYDTREYNMFFMNPTDFHHVRVTEPMEVMNISFDEDMIDDSDMGRLTSLDAERAYSLTPDEYRRIVMAAELLKYEYEAGSESCRLLLRYIQNCILQGRRKPTLQKPRVEHSHGVKKAIVYMEIHFREDISLSKVAADIGYHPAYFSELFKRTTGETFMEYLVKLRIGYARSMLAGGFSVSDACFLSGFGSLSSFSATFKKHCGVSPGAYKTQQRIQTKNGIHDGMQAQVFED